MTKLWEEKEWKERNKKLLKKKCEQCGSKEKLQVHHDPSFKTILFFKIRELGITKLCKEQEIDKVYPSGFQGTAGFQYLKKGKKGYIKVKDLRKYIRDHPKIKEKAEELAKKDYLKTSKVSTLCMPCHFNLHKGRILCSYCKKGYHNPYFMSCYNCREIAEKDYKEFEERMDKQEEQMLKEINLMNQKIKDDS